MYLNQIINFLINEFNNPKQYNNGYNFWTVSKHSCSFIAPVVNTAFIEVYFPGYKTNQKTNKYDYLVKLSNSNKVKWSVSHREIISLIYLAIFYNKHLAIILEDLLIDIAHNWEHVNLGNYSKIQNAFHDMSLEEFIEVICWISVQEEMNYPSTNGYFGYKRPFYSYLEAIYSALYPNKININDVHNRAISNSRFTPLYVTGINIPYNKI